MDKQTNRILMTKLHLHSMQCRKKHQYRRHFQGCHDRRKVAKSECYKINGKHFHSKN